MNTNTTGDEREGAIAINENKPIGDKGFIPEDQSLTVTLLNMTLLLSWILKIIPIPFQKTDQELNLLFRGTHKCL